MLSMWITKNTVVAISAQEVMMIKIMITAVFNGARIWFENAEYNVSSPESSLAPGLLLGPLPPTAYLLAYLLAYSLVRAETYGGAVDSDRRVALLTLEVAGWGRVDGSGDGEANRRRRC